MGEVSVVDGPDWVPPRRGRELRLSRCSWREAMTVGTIESRRANEGLEVSELKTDPLATNQVFPYSSASMVLRCEKGSDVVEALVVS
jgi:hypothetical protein